MSEMLLLLRDVLRTDDAEQESRLDDGLIARISGTALSADFAAESRARDADFAKRHAATYAKHAPASNWSWNEPLTRVKPLEKRTGTFAQNHQARLEAVSAQLEKLFSRDSEEFAEGLSLAKRILGGEAAETLTQNLLEETPE